MQSRLSLWTKSMLVLPPPTISQLPQRPPWRTTWEITAAGKLARTESALQTRAGTAALQQEHVSPDISQLADFPPHADFSKSASFVQRDAGGVLLENASLQSPDSA